VASPGFLGLKAQTVDGLGTALKNLTTCDPKGKISNKEPAMRNSGIG
jgi:hypothetical protein